jgi:hypothetical protein
MKQYIEVGSIAFSRLPGGMVELEQVGSRAAQEGVSNARVRTGENRSLCVLAEKDINALREFLNEN